MATSRSCEMTILVSCCLLAALAGWATGAVATGDPSAAAPPRPTELSNPDDETMVLLYYEFAGIPVPIDAWVERDPQLSMAPAPDKQAMREQLRGSLGAAVEGVKTVGPWDWAVPLDANSSTTPSL